MFLRALFTMLAADAIDRHRREQQYKAWLAEYEVRTAAAPRAAWMPSGAAAYDSERPT